jgi:hypothetical protein
MRCVVHICRTTDHHGYQLRLVALKVERMGGVELFEHEQALSARIIEIGLSAVRLRMTLSNLRAEDQAIWFDCEIREGDFEKFGSVTVADSK